MNKFIESGKTVEIVIGSDSESLRDMFPGGPGCSLFAELIDNVNLKEAIRCGLYKLNEVREGSVVWEDFCDVAYSPVPSAPASLVMSWIHRETPVDKIHVMALELLVGGEFNVVVVGRT